jgi:predicted RNase H-like HicB family nuclease
MKLKVVIHKAEEGGYWAEVPALPGCFTQGETLQEIETNIREAVNLYIESANDSADNADEILELTY